MADFKLIGKSFGPPDLEAKITGRAKFAEDFRAEGMLFAKLLVSPMPHCRVTRIDASEALAMPGVEAILTADDLPEGGAAPRDERALTMDPLYEGEPILAVAAVDETTAADAIDRIRVDLEPLPFVIDPLDSLRPGGPDARVGGNISVRGEDGTVLESRKWSQELWDAAGDGLPMGEPTTEWLLGDLDVGFAEADVIIEESVFHQSQTHHPLETRSCMAYWLGSKLHIHVSTQSTARTVAPVAAGVGIDPSDVVLVGEYCGGAFGSKISGTVNMPIPALLARKTGRPVMLRVTRAEENYFGRARPGFQARVKIGMRRDGRVTAIDMYIVQDNGPYGSSGDHGTAANLAQLTYQPENMRFRGITIFTNTPPRGAQRGPGGVQEVAIMAPLMDKACRELGVDRIEHLRANLPGHNAMMRGRRGLAELSSCFVREALELGVERFDWAAKSAMSGRRQGTKVTGIGVAASPYTAGSSGYDGLIVLQPDGKLYIHQGIGNLGTHSIADTGKAAAEVIDISWDQCEIIWGDSRRHLPWSSVQAGSQTTHAHTRANWAAGLDLERKLQQIAAMDLGGSPADYEVTGGRVVHASDRGRTMSFRRAATRAIALGGIFDGHELPEDLNPMTVTSATALVGQGLMGVSRDNFDRGGGLQSWVVGFARVEVDVETGMVDIVEYVGATDCGTVLNPRSLKAQVLGGSIQGFGVARSQKWVYDPQWGVPFTKGFHTAKPPTILDVPLEVDVVAADLPDPFNPVGCKGIGEPPMGAGAGAIAAAIEDALGGVGFNRTPITTDMIMAALEDQPQPVRGLTAHI